MVGNIDGPRRYDVQTVRLGRMGGRTECSMMFVLRYDVKHDHRTGITIMIILEVRIGCVHILHQVVSRTGRITVATCMSI